MSLSKPSSRYASFTAVVGSRLFLWGGRTPELGENPVRLLYYFEFSKEVWGTGYINGEQPPGFKFGSCATDTNGDLYVYGGEDEQHRYTGELYKINTSNIEDFFFEEISKVNTLNLPLKKNDSGMVVYKGNVILFGGKPVSEGSDERTNELHIFHTRKGIAIC